MNELKFNIVDVIFNKLNPLKRKKFKIVKKEYLT